MFQGETEYTIGSLIGKLNVILILFQRLKFSGNDILIRRTLSANQRMADGGRMTCEEK
jgi:hypothetical protein